MAHAEPGIIISFRINNSKEYHSRLEDNFSTKIALKANMISTTYSFCG